MAKINLIRKIIDKYIDIHVSIVKEYETKVKSQIKLKDALAEKNLDHFLVFLLANCERIELLLKI